MRKIKGYAKAFLVPLVILGGILLAIVLSFAKFSLAASLILLIVTLIGSYSLIEETITSLVKWQFGLDYIAILAISVAIFTKELYVAAVLALMVSGGRTLEDYGVSQAKRSLTRLVDRIPTDMTLWKKDKPGEKEKLHNITVGDEVFLRKGEVIGLDGTLVSGNAQIDESSLTGEPYFVDKIQDDIIRSGTINIGQPIVVRVTKTEKDSTYRKIITMVKEAEEEKSPFIRLADEYSTFFTLITLAIALFAFFYSHFELIRALAVLAVATPCPLIIATPIALLGGVNAAARKKIIVKKLAALEILARVNTLLFDKTGTITLGIPQVSKVQLINKKYSLLEVLSITEALERNSLHPLAKALVAKARLHHASIFPATHVTETIGKGISGEVKGKTYTLSPVENIGMAIALFEEKKKIATFELEDEIKKESKQTIAHLLSHNFTLKILTGDKKEAAQKVVEELGSTVQVHAQCSPEDKQKEIENYKKQGRVTAMVGDGINDAPALALADVGLAFSNQEQTAASEAADIVLLGSGFSMILNSLHIAMRTIRIARQSILWGIGLSIAAMVAATFGLIPPIAGAILQEGIDVAVILNALRASR